MNINYFPQCPTHLIIGDPIAHSLSPFIYNTLYQRYQLDIACFTAQIPKGGIKALGCIMNAMNTHFINATHPHKGDIIPLLSSLDQDAQLYQSVNTVLVKNEALYGYSTDAKGFSLSLKEKNLTLTGRRILLLGAGGAGSTIALNAVESRADKLYIFNRDAGKAEALCKKAEALNQRIGGTAGCAYGSLEDQELLAETAARCDMVVHTTPVGMTGYPGEFEDKDLLFLESLPRHSTVCDIIYAPRKTKLLQRAEALGFNTVEGLGMLIWQAFAAFEIFHGILPSQQDKEHLTEQIYQRYL